MKQTFFTCTLLFSGIFLSAQQPYQPYRTANDIILDGKLDEAEWQLTPVETEFMQQGPDAGATPTEKTEVRILYNDDYLFIGITCFDSEPDKLVQVEMERDFPIGQEDGTGVTIDTYHDKITAIGFISNTLDARWDAQITRDGAGQSDSYNTFWDVRSFVNDKGYTTEYRIPFSSLRFEEKPVVIMGFRIARLIKRKNELITYPKCDPKTNNAWTNVSFARDIEFHDLKARNPLYISPYVIANYYEENILNDAGTGYTKNADFMTRKNFAENETLDKIISNIGIDAKYGITKNLTLDLTINTDFAQAEVDDRIINLSKYEVNLPEKRSFFLEAANQLSFGFPSGNELFITRKIGNENGIIVPILGGARLTGKVGEWQLGALNMQTTGFQNTTDTIAPHNFTVLRTRRDIDELGSFIGGIICNRVNTDTSTLSNQSFGIDFVKRLNQQLTIEGGIANTLVDFNTDSIMNSLYFHTGVFQAANSGFIYSGTIDLVGKDINPVMGYMDENDYGFGNTKFGYQWDISKTNALQYIYIFTNNAYRWKLHSGERETFSSNIFPGIVFKNGASIDFSLFEYKIDSLFYDWYLDDENAIAAGTYAMLNNSLTLTSPQQSNYTASLFSSYGGFYGGDHFFVAPEVTWWATKHLNISYTYEYNHIRFDHFLHEKRNTDYASSLMRLGVNYNFTTKVSIKSYFQFDDLSHQMSSNIRFRFNPREGTDLFIVVNQGLNSDRTRLDPKLPYINNQAVTVKFTRTFGQ